MNCLLSNGADSTQVYNAIVSTGIRPLVYGGFITVLVPLALVVVAAMLAFGTVHTAFDQSARTDSVVDAASEIDRGTLTMRRLVDLFNLSTHNDKFDSIKSTAASLDTSIARLRTALGGQETPVLTKLTNALAAYSRDIGQLAQMKHEEATLANDQLEPLAVTLTKRLETLSAATESTARGDSVVLCRRLLSAFLHVRLVADRALSHHDRDAYFELDDVLEILSSNLYAFLDRASEILAGPDTAKQMQTYIAILNQATKLHQTIDDLIAGPMQISGQDLLSAAAQASAMVSQARDEATSKARNELELARTLLLGLGATGLLVGIAAAWGIGRQISGGIRRITRTMEELAGGDLTIEPPFLRYKGEFGAMGRALGVFRDSMAEGVRLARQREEADRELRVQHLRFSAALSNMSEALCMFDSAGRLVVGNDRLAGILRLPLESIPLGVTIEGLQQTLTNLAGANATDIQALLYTMLRLQSQGQRIAHVQDLRDGRSLALNFAPVDQDGWLVTFEDITNQRLIEAKIAHMAHHDFLTGLANRVLFLDRLGGAIERGLRGEKSALLCLDLDKFKGVNDTLGHPVGDRLLRDVATRLKDSVRATDTVARLGGDEFAVVQAGIHQPGDCKILAQRLIDRISAPYEFDGHKIIIGTSIGIALVPKDGEDCDDLMKAADMALYRSKAEGRGRCTFFEPAMDPLQQERRTPKLICAEL